MKRIGANRQRIANLFPPADRLVFVASDRQRIASIGGRGTCCSRHLGACSLPFLRCLCPRFIAGDYAAILSNWRENTLCTARSPAPSVTLPRRPTTDSADRNRHESASKVAAPADIQGGDAVADEEPPGLSDALAVRR